MEKIYFKISRNDNDYVGSFYASKNKIRKVYPDAKFIDFDEYWKLRDTCDDISFNGKCGEQCKYYWGTATEGHGVCSAPESFFPVCDGDNCPYIPHSTMGECGLKCKDCTNIDDFSCMTCDPEDSIIHSHISYKGEVLGSICCGFDWELKERFFRCLQDLYSKGVRYKDIIETWAEELEEKRIKPELQEPFDYFKRETDGE